MEATKIVRALQAACIAASRRGRSYARCAAMWAATSSPGSFRKTIERPVLGETLDRVRVATAVCQRCGRQSVLTLRHLRRQVLEGAIDEMCLDAGGSRFGDLKEAMVSPVPTRKKLYVHLRHPVFRDPASDIRLKISASIAWGQRSASASSRATGQTIGIPPTGTAWGNVVVGHFAPRCCSPGSLARGGGVGSALSRGSRPSRQHD